MKERVHSMILLAGGKSSRMGTDKADLCMNGKTFLEIQLEKAEKLGLDQVLISGYHGQHTDLPYPVIPDDIPDKGPLGGMSTCLTRLPAGKCLVITVDVVLLPEEVLQKLLDYAADSKSRAVILQHQEKQEPLIGVYDTSLAGDMVREYTENKGSVFPVLRRAEYDVYISDADPAFFANINTPEDYRNISI